MSPPASSLSPPASSLSPPPSPLSLPPSPPSPSPLPGILMVSLAVSPPSNSKVMPSIIWPIPDSSLLCRLSAVMSGKL
ncbi:MAG TPA: hypothetical protein DIT01_16680 [Lentisphaeria bacterium]|nr:hypothetical protein [Lentisphaeria bacterium]